MQAFASREGLYTSSHGDESAMQRPHPQIIPFLTPSQSDLFMNMSLEDFQTGVKPKVDGSWNLHSLLPKGMDFFILLSSIGGILGTSGMANYACGNTYQDALAKHRIARHEKAISLDLCEIEDVGYVAERDLLTHSSLPSRGTPILTESEMLALLDHYCNPNLPLASPTQSQVVFGIQGTKDVPARNVNENFPLNRPMFKIMRQGLASLHAGTTTTSDSDSATAVDLTSTKLQMSSRTAC